MKLMLLFIIFIINVRGQCHLSCPAHTITKTVDEKCYYEIEDLRHSLTTNCEGIIQSGLGGYFPEGTHTVTFTDTDNMQSCDIRLNVVDDIPPNVVGVRGEPNLLLHGACNNEWKDVNFHFNKNENCCKVYCNITDVTYEDLDMSCCYECQECRGKVTKLVLRNYGQTGIVHVTDKKGDNVFFSQMVQTLQTFTITPLDGEDTLGTKIFVNGVEIHTSCSQPIYIGMRFEAFEVVYGESKRGGRLCASPPSSRKRSGSDDDDNHDDRDNNDRDNNDRDMGCFGEPTQYYITGSRSVRLCAAHQPCKKRIYTVTGMCFDKNGLSAKKTTTVASTQTLCTDPDPTCEHGLVGKGGICCPETCGHCGGLGCGTRPGGASQCCGGQIVHADQSCDTNPAPCVISTN